MSQNNGDLPQLWSYRVRHRRRSNSLAWVFITLSVVLLLLAVLTPLWLPAAIRLIPDRYVAAYAPEFVQDIAFERRVDADALPTPAPSDNDEIFALLEDLPMPVTPSPLPTVMGGIPTELAAPEVPYGTPTLAFLPEETPVTPNALPYSLYLNGMSHTYQGWNNCGPASITTALSYWGVESTQSDAAAFLKPNPEDRNVRPDEIEAYVESLGFEMVVRVNGNLDLLKQLIAAGYPVMIEKGFDPEPDELGWMGHYLVLNGFSDDEQAFNTMDSYLGPNRLESYEYIDTMWRHFNRVYLVIYRPDQAENIAQIIGEDMDDATMLTNSVYRAQAELNITRDDAFGWFNLGSSLSALGRYEEAAAAFDQARSIGLPWRMLWYQYGPYEAYIQVGGNRLYDVRTLADVTLENNVYSEEAYYYKGLALASQGQVSQARSQFNLALRYNKNYQDAQTALNALTE